MKIVQSWPSCIPRGSLRVRSPRQTSNTRLRPQQWQAVLPCLPAPQQHCQDYSESQPHRVSRKAPHQVCSLGNKHTKALKQERTRRARMLGGMVHRAAMIKMSSRARNRKRIRHRSLEIRTKKPRPSPGPFLIPPKMMRITSWNLLNIWLVLGLANSLHRSQRRRAAQKL